MEKIEFQIPEDYEVELVSEKLITLKPKIVNPEWIENLKTEKYRNGDVIPYAYTNEEWRWYGRNGIGCRCIYKNKDKYIEKYGYLYNWFAVNDPRGLAPKDCHIPTDKEIMELSFSDKLPGGFRNGYHGTFSLMGIDGFWWSSTAFSSTDAWSRAVYCNSDDVYHHYIYKGDGLSIRCIRDS